MGRCRQAWVQAVRRKPWTTSDMRYLEQHAHEGATAVAKQLGRTPEAVRIQACRYGISMRARWYCPRCGMWVHRPLSTRTGWCRACTLEVHNARLADEARNMEAELAREAEMERARQAIYARRSRARQRKK